MWYVGNVFELKLFAFYIVFNKGNTNCEIDLYFIRRKKFNVFSNCSPSDSVIELSLNFILVLVKLTAIWSVLIHVDIGRKEIEYVPWYLPYSYSFFPSKRRWLLLLRSFFFMSVNSIKCVEGDSIIATPQVVHIICSFFLQTNNMRHIIGNQVKVMLLWKKGKQTDCNGCADKKKHI
jgi:hypothetical protein